MNSFRHIDPSVMLAGATAAEQSMLARIFLTAGVQQWEQVRIAERRRDVPALLKGLHTLRGSLAVLSARTALGAAAEVEEACRTDPTGCDPRFTTLEREMACVIGEVETMAREAGE